MRVKIGNYTNWFGPYQLAEKLCFWAKPVEGEYGIKANLAGCTTLVNG